MTRLPFAAISPAALRTMLEISQDNSETGGEGAASPPAICPTPREMIDGSLLTGFTRRKIGRAAPRSSAHGQWPGRTVIQTVEPRLCRRSADSPKRAHQGWRYFEEKGCTARSRRWRGRRRGNGPAEIAWRTGESGAGSRRATKQVSQPVPASSRRSAACVSAGQAP